MFWAWATVIFRAEGQAMIGDGSGIEVLRGDARIEAGTESSTISRRAGWAFNPVYKILESRYLGKGHDYCRHSP